MQLETIALRYINCSIHLGGCSYASSHCHCLRARVGTRQACSSPSLGTARLQRACSPLCAGGRSALKSQLARGAGRGILRSLQRDGPSRCWLTWARGQGERQEEQGSLLTHKRAGRGARTNPRGAQMVAGLQGGRGRTQPPSSWRTRRREER